jgi:hypothetical protein
MICRIFDFTVVLTVKRRLEEIAPLGVISMRDVYLAMQRKYRITSMMSMHDRASSRVVAEGPPGRDRTRY